MLPKVSIMIPTYNQSKFISDAIESALAQDYPNLEIIVSDDCSTDNTFEIIKRYKDHRLKYFRNERNIGKHNNYRQLLYEYATGQWCIMLDGDDYFVNRSFIKNAMDLIVSNKNVVACLAGAKVVLPSGFSRGRWPLKPFKNEYSIQRGREVFLSWYKRVFFFHGATLYKRDLAISVDFYKHGVIGDDTVSLLKLILHGDVAFLKKIVYVWRLHKTNISLATALDKRVENIIIVEDVYNYAQSLNLFSYKELEKWKKGMITKLAKDTINIMRIQKKYVNILTLFKFLFKEYPLTTIRISGSVIKNLGYHLYRLIKK